MHRKKYKTLWTTVDKFCDKITKERLFVDKTPYFMQKIAYKEQFMRLFKKYSTKTNVCGRLVRGCFG